MRHILVNGPLLACILLFPGATSHPSIPADNPVSRQAMYYWYQEPGDIYNDFETVANEEYEMWLWYGGTIINTNPIGGTLIEEGFYNNAYPHNEEPYIYLYAHFTSAKVKR